MDVVVFGAGSLGSLVGGLLAREHRVTLVGREPHVGAVADHGLRIDGQLDHHVYPRATTDVAGCEADLALVTVKAYDTAAAARALADADVDAVCSLQNGLDNETTLASRVDAPVLAGTATYGASLAEPGRVTCTGVGQVTVGPREGGRSPLADDVGAAFRRAGVETRVASDMARRRWWKLAVNAGINPVTALARVPNAGVRGGPARQLARDAAREAARVAGEHGVDVSPDDVATALEDVAASTARNRSSMLRDVEAGRRTEIDAINGTVVDRAVAADVAVPVNRTLTRLVRSWERERGLR